MFRRDFRRDLESNRESFLKAVTSTKVDEEPNDRLSVHARQTRVFSQRRERESSRVELPILWELFRAT